ncbi:GntR family transcriptional regulator [Bifidobacterium reuteri DSM 23975]|uniref:GntR family transcriptional regulator n=1 Tax=Bifidobacterium reuteri DSM 23975 TaxID=1437610 RepID=A0A087CVH0_9BIFI|nr:aminotransferase class I/II-fold pyridoxal phosphate-dependent enzyme [Bifidobacterium reuteri]KFI87270.1 GntR family transcriptional regulator [Bifidobacterium reuteri DSM 23975]
MSVYAAYSHIANNLGAPPFLPLNRDHVGDVPLVNLTGGVPAADILPYESYSQAVGRVLGNPATAFSSVSYVSPFGIQELREQVAHWRGVPVENVLVTNGAMNGIFLAAQTLIDPGDTVLVESPTFPFALNIFRRAGARLESIALHAGGIDLDELEQRLREGRRYKLFYTIPDFQNLPGP